MSDERTMAIVCASGGFRGAFVHGVLAAFEEHGLRADAYAGVSSTAPIAAAAAAGQARNMGIQHWLGVLAHRNRTGGDMSSAVQEGINTLAPLAEDALFQPDAPRLMIVASEVINEAAAIETQGSGATKLGRRLLVEAGRGRRYWVEHNLRPVFFDRARMAGPALTRENLRAVLYASTRMLHAWSTPAEIDGKPFVDGSYTLACPAAEIAGMRYDQVLVIGTQPGPIPTDLVGDRTVGAWLGDVPITTMTPDMDPADLNVDFVTAGENGLGELFNHGREKGAAFVR